MFKRIRSLFNSLQTDSKAFDLFGKCNQDIEILDEESKFERMIRHLKKKFRRSNKLKLTCFILSFLFIFLFTLSLFTGKNIALVGVKIVLNSVGIYTEEISSVDISSNNYDNEGSWKINKGAKWTSSNTAEVVFDVNSIRKTDGTKKDIILVLDVSGSMSGDKITNVINDTKDLVKTVLSDSNNRITLITFNESSSILSDFSNDKDSLIEKLDKISVSGSTNYNSALKNVDSIMDGYVKEDGRDIVTLFLTDGYPNYDTPNQEGTYEILKDKYPYMSIKGIQYEMGKDIIKEIKNISDEQWSADKTTLNNVLFEAAISPSKYEEFIVNDYISDEFTVNSVDDIEVSLGKVELTEEDGLQKITWDLGNSQYITGSNAKMTIKLTLDDKYVDEFFIPTNNKESITYKLEDDSEKNINSSESPVLKYIYKVNYDTNTPSGCKIDKIDSENHRIYDSVKKKTDELSCDGYVFKGWEIDDEDSTGMKKLGNDYFLMPGHDVTMRATWTKQSITKEMDGTVHEKTTLYKVLENEAEIGSYATEYTGDHQDSMDKSKSTQKIFYWDGKSDKNASVIQDKFNVIFAGQCWQMLRTTDTGGVKMIYNGEAEDGKCLSTRGEHVGYSGTTTKTLDTSYYYGTDYTYDSIKKSFSLSGIVTTGSINIGQYTCLSTSQTGTCVELYYVSSLNNGTTYDVFSLSSNANYTQFGKLPFNNSDSSVSDVGYMYGNRYTYRENQSYKYYILSHRTSFSSDIWFADSATYDENKKIYSLDNPYQMTSISDSKELVGKYTFSNKYSTFTGSTLGYIVGVYIDSSSGVATIYTTDLTGGEITLSDKYTFGDSYTDNGDGTYTINDSKTVNNIYLFDNYKDLANKYICINANNNICNDVWYTTYMHYENFGYASVKDSFLFGNSFVYMDGKYKLVDTKTINATDYTKDRTILNNYHYTCYNETGECTTLSYVYYSVSTTNYYINLSDGKDVDDALEEMLFADDVNKYDSIIKSGIDAWYESMLLNYSDYLEDTIFCNDRSIYLADSFNPNGGNVGEQYNIKFNNYNLSRNLSCTNETDKFSTENEKAKLKYKVGLISSSEMYLLDSYSLRKTDNQYWLLSPYLLRNSSVNGYNINSQGQFTYGYFGRSNGVRPAISLIPGIEYSSGDGSMENPYVIDTE